MFCVPGRIRTFVFSSLRIQTAVIGTYAQQVVTRVVGYSWCLCPACAPARIYGPARLSTKHAPLPISVLGENLYLELIALCWG